MYVADMSLEEAREWKAEVEEKLDNGAIPHPSWHQLQDDLQDLNDRISELENL